MKSKKASLAKSLGLLVVAIGSFMALRWCLYEPYVIPSGSMMPTLLINDHILVAKYSFGLRLPFSSTWVMPPHLPERGDVVVFRSVEQDDYYMIKRVVGLPGDTISYSNEGDLRINGQIVSRTELQWPPWLARTEIKDDPARYTLWNEKLGAHNHWVLLEKDAIHAVEEEHVVPPGMIFLMGDNRDRSRDSRFWGELPAEKLLGQALWIWLSCDATVSEVNFLCDPRHIRWNRTFHRIE